MENVHILCVFSIALYRCVLYSHLILKLFTVLKMMYRLITQAGDIAETLDFSQMSFGELINPFKI